MTVFQEIVVESILPNQIRCSWYHSFQKTMFFLMKSKYAIFSNIKVKKTERSSFGGTPGIVPTFWTNMKFRGKIKFCYLFKILKRIKLVKWFPKQFSRKLYLCFMIWLNTWYALNLELPGPFLEGLLRSSIASLNAKDPFELHSFNR